MIGFGVGEIIGAFFQGWFIDKYSAKWGAILNMVLILITITLTVISIAIERYNFLTYVVSFFWGIQDGTVNIHTL